jgi:sulfatase maturation enzyme AslB (radical SAM superfamily)
MDKLDRLCLAPWTHTYLSPQTERRLCCASREPAQNFEQYIDTAAGTGEYRPVTLAEYWNSESVRRVRRQMMAGEAPPECEVCNQKLLNTDVYRSYFNQLFGHKRTQLLAATDSTGRTPNLPISWDYRFSNLCNFKCRMCGDMLSSSWESEQRTHNMIDWSNSKNNWMRPEIKQQITEFQDTVIEQEFSQAVEQHRVEEVYWVGGEPLMYEQHWRYMQRIIELGDGKNVYARYNTNLSRVDYRGCNLYSDILAHIRDWQICASLDGTGRTGEYIRTGLDYGAWRLNFEQGLKYAQHRRQMRIDFTLTLPGLFEVQNIQKLADEYNVDVLAKVVFSFTPDIILSPLALPRKLLERKIEEIIPGTKGALRDVLNQLGTRPTFAEQWNQGGAAAAALTKGKQRILQLEQLRGDTYTLRDILAEDPEIQEWYDKIPT